MQISEKTIQTDILAWLNFNGFFAWKNHLGGIHRAGQPTTKNPNRGAPDIFAVKDGFFLGIEVKAPGGRPAEHQILWLEKFRQHGGHPVIASSLDACITAIKQTGIKTDE